MACIREDAYLIEDTTHLECLISNEAKEDMINQNQKQALASSLFSSLLEKTSTSFGRQDEDVTTTPSS
jgi:hypothetical protein